MSEPSQSEQALMDWHRIFGLILSDFFTDTPFEVELELDLSIQQSFLDVVVIRKREGQLNRPVPDGFGNLAEYNLITFKSHRQALDEWALKELGGHYVSYRKWISPDKNNLIPEEKFRFFGVCARKPESLAQQLELVPVQEGVYRCHRGNDEYTIIVANGLPREQRNAMLCLFSSNAEQIQFGANNFQKHCSETGGVLNVLLQKYLTEGLDMPYSLKDFRKDIIKELTAEELQQIPPEKLQQIPPERRLEGIPPEQRLEGIPPEQRLEGIPPEQRLEGIPPEQRLEGIPPEQRLEGIPPEQRLEGIPPEQWLEGISTEDLKRILRQRQQAQPEAEGSDPPADD